MRRNSIHMKPLGDLSTRTSLDKSSFTSKNSAVSIDQRTNLNGEGQKPSLIKAASMVTLTQSLHRRKKKHEQESNPDSGLPTLLFLETDKKVDKGSLLP
jgi:hypothetical protein